MSSAKDAPPTSAAEGTAPALVSGGTPLVVGVMLTADRPEMTARAIRSFEAQTYERKCLLVLDSGTEGPNLRTSIRLIYKHVLGKYSVGELRNLANAMAAGADIIAHFDSDDWSHPRRLEEQVVLLQASGADCVGYNEILFWESSKPVAMLPRSGAFKAEILGEAWIYENDALDISQKFNPGYENSYPPVGASYCYWRAAWERLPFPEIQKGEDSHWKRKGARCYGLTAMEEEPRLICEIHGGNTSSKIQHGFSEFRRAPSFDDYCKLKMEAVNVNT